MKNLQLVFSLSLLMICIALTGYVLNEMPSQAEIKHSIERMQNEQNQIIRN